MWGVIHRAVVHRRAAVVADVHGKPVAAYADHVIPGRFDIQRGNYSRETQDTGRFGEMVRMVFKAPLGSDVRDTDQVIVPLTGTALPDGTDSGVTEPILTGTFDVTTIRWNADGLLVLLRKAQ